MRVVMTLIWSLAICSASERGLPAQHGIANFGEISTHIFRGAQPDADGIAKLKELGVKTIINLRTTKGARREEALAAQNQGILYTNIPFRGIGRPKDPEVKAVLALIASSPGPVFIHCEHGCDRTGTIIACYRIEYDHWSSQVALQEAAKYGLSKLERGMKKYVMEFDKKWRNSKAPE